MKHYFNEGKEIINQGRSKRQYRNNAMLTFISGVGFIITFILILIFG